MEDDDMVELSGLIGKYGVEEILIAAVASEQQQHEELQSELLEICERLLGFAMHYASASSLEAGSGLIASARAAIAKARGE